MIVISLGANLSLAGGTPRDTLEAALAALNEGETRVAAHSRWYLSAPLPPSDQPDYLNGIALLDSDLDPLRLLKALHDLEDRFGRRRVQRWGMRTLDLDLIDHHGFTTLNGWQGGQLHDADENSLCLPHPRAHERAFVLRPLMEVAPAWRHPVFGLQAGEMLTGAVARQRCTPAGGKVCRNLPGPST